ncbi:unnamed protein product [Rotaria sordida]|uniref:HTH OST-type domain-containing protein n=1 Tax=Rotaria sordida TaxID=392033 RepID=A0A815QH89_9BILA|nr:unnamed protein product [Rotaria sordida]CAF1642722.1 unnamed protein product [Rotaria sordida]
MTLSLLDEIKIEIRSLLISSKDGLTEDELCHDYSLFNSQRLLPYEIFGYSTITNFLNSLTDILYRSSDGYIYPIVDHTTEHIFKFVQQQRTKKKKINTKQTSFIYNQQENFSIYRHKQKRTVSFEQKHRTIDAIKPFSPKFERVNVTNELLQCLLMHFRQQQ